MTDIHVHVHGPVNITVATDTNRLETEMSQISDAVAQETADTSAVVVALNDLAAKVSAGTATAADAQAAVDALNASHATLTAAVAADDPAPAPAPAPPVDPNAPPAA